MSYESTIDRFRTQLAVGTAHRRRVEQRRRVTVLGVVAVVVLLSAGLFATRRGDTGPTVATTAMTAQQKAVCDAYLDYVSTPPTPDDLTRARWLDALGEQARRLDRTDPLAELAQRLARGSDTEGFFDAYNDIKLRCRDLGHPDFNPVYVAAPLPDGAIAPDLLIGAEPQLFHGTTISPLLYNSVTLGRNLSTVQVAVTDLDGFVMAWDYGTGTGQRWYCIATGTRGDDMSRNDENARCATSREAMTVDDFTLSYRRQSRTSVVVQTLPSVATVIVTVGDERLVQQPVLNQIVVNWRVPTDAQVTVRGYDANGQELQCKPDAALC